MSRRRAFTLVELLVVIGIIALLLSILMPALNGVRAKAARTKCMAQLQQFMLAVTSYVNNDKDTRLPFSNSESLETPAAAGQKPTFGSAGWLYQLPSGTDLTNRTATWTPVLRSDINGVNTGTLWQYIQNYEIYHCPLDQDPDKWGVHGPAQQLSSYMMNGAVCGYAKTVPFKTNMFKASEQVIFFEGDEKLGGKDATGNWDGIWNDGNNDPSNGLSGRHQSGGCLAFFDSHIEWWSLDRWTDQKALKPGPLWCNPARDDGAYASAP